MAKNKTAEQQIIYLMFECCLINHIKNTAAILSYSIVRYAINQVDGSDYQILNEAIAMHFDKMLPDHLSTVITKAQITTRPIENYDITATYNRLIYYLNQGSDDSNFESFINSVRIYYQIRCAINILELKLTSGNYDVILKDYRQLSKLVNTHEALYGKDALVSLKVSMLMDFIKNEKDNRDYQLLKAFAAVKSIQGDKDFAVTNKKFITARMIGAKTPDIAHSMMKDKTIKKLLDGFNGRYFYDRIIEDLELKKFITSILPGNRCVYISTSLPYELLKPAVENLKQSTGRKGKIQVLKAKKHQYKIDV